MAAPDQKSNSLRVGILLIPPVQLLDASSIDAFGMLTPSYLAACGLPAPLVNLAIPVSIHYISASGQGTHASMTASATLPVTDSLNSPAVQPGQLDVLLIPGPDPNLVPDEPVLDFIRAHQKADQTDFLVICTGSYPAGYAGLLDGKRVTGPRALVPKLSEKFPQAKFVERRWERDGRLWSSGGYYFWLLMIAWAMMTMINLWNHFLLSLILVALSSALVPSTATTPCPLSLVPRLQELVCAPRYH